MYALLTWPQIHLLLDGAGYNAPRFDDSDAEGGKGKDRPPAPDKRKQPVEFLRWQLQYGPGVPPSLRMDKEGTEALCQRFADDIAAGVKVWSDEKNDWVTAHGG